MEKQATGNGIQTLADFMRWATDNSEGKIEISQCHPKIAALLKKHQDKSGPEGKLR